MVESISLPRKVLKTMGWQRGGGHTEGVGLVLGVLDLVANGLDVLGCGATENNCLRMSMDQSAYVQMSHALVLGTELLGQTD